MKIFDFNIHLPFLKDPDVNKVIEQDLSMTVTQLSEGLHYSASELKKVTGANFQLFNTDLLDTSIGDFQNEVQRNCDHFYLTCLVNFRRSDIAIYLSKVKDAGIKAIMFNSYLQQIGDADFAAVYLASSIAEKLGLIICIDGSYGTSKMFEYNNSKLACHIADVITKVPIVIVHSGGYNILRSMLLSLDKPNVWLDTSFSLPFYIGSSIENDFAFAYKKMSYEKIVFGSDHPYMDLDTSIEIHQQFFEKYKFPSAAIENIFFNNAVTLFS